MFELLRVHIGQHSGQQSIYPLSYRLVLGGWLHKLVHDYYRLSLMYDPAEGNYIIFSVDKLSSLHLKRIDLSVEYPPYKRLLCWRFRMSIRTFASAYDHLPELADVADYSEAGSTLGAGESTEESASSTLGVEEGSTKD
jgi:hypothetical protein